MLPPLEELRDRILAAVPGADVALVPPASPGAEASLVVEASHVRDVALSLRDHPELRLDYCSNATGVDWLDREIVETVKSTITDPATGEEKVVQEKRKRVESGYLETVYHLYSMALKHGPLVLRVRTANRTDAVTLPSLTAVWRSCEFQEREIFDLFGIVFDGHPDLRRILMWDGFADHPMRKDYADPDDHEWEPTPHGAVHDRAKRHYPAAPTEGGNA